MLHFFAFFHLSRVFETHSHCHLLPFTKTRQNWTSSVDCEVVFFSDVFSQLQKKIQAKELQPECVLVCDGMKIKSSVTYNKSTGSFDGFVNFGKDIVASDEDKVATEALVFMLVGLRNHWKYPVGYVLCDSITAVDLHSLLSKALRISLDHGLEPISVTMDGAHSNTASMRKFGCKLGNTLSKIDGLFTFEYNGLTRSLYFTPDADHMLKLARNTIADLGVLVDGQGLSIDWRFIVKLHELQVDEGFRFGNKLSKKHIAFQRHKMNVSIAAQTLSSSVADALEFLMLANHPYFADAGGTIKFIRVIDKLFDLLNSRNLHAKGFKRPLKAIDKALWLNTIKESTEYLSQLKTYQGVSILKHRRKTFALGLITTAFSIRDIAKELLFRSIDPFPFLLTYKRCFRSPVCMHPREKWIQQ